MSPHATAVVKRCSVWPSSAARGLSLLTARNRTASALDGRKVRALRLVAEADSHQPQHCMTPSRRLRTIGRDGYCVSGPPVLPASDLAPGVTNLSVRWNREGINWCGIGIGNEQSRSVYRSFRQYRLPYRRHSGPNWWTRPASWNRIYVCQGLLGETIRSARPSTLHA